MITICNTSASEGRSFDQERFDKFADVLATLQDKLIDSLRTTEAKMAGRQEYHSKVFNYRELKQEHGCLSQQTEIESSTPAMKRRFTKHSFKFLSMLASRFRDSSQIF